MPKSLFYFGSQATVSTARSPSPSTSPTAISDDSADAAPSSSSSSARDRIDNIHARVTRTEAEELAYRRKIVPRLAQRAYHLEEGNSWWTDWVQYQKNTHPVFGLFMYHRLHPIRFPQRFIILIGSIACGFAITNCVYLGFLEEGAREIGLESAYNATGTVADFVSDVQQRYTHVEIKPSMFYLLTVGCFIHSTFDMVIWYLMACFCFRPGGGFKTNKRCQTVGIYMGVMVVLFATGVATYFVLLRLDEDIKNQADYEPTNSEEFAEEIIGDNESAARFSFFVGYALELVCALFFFYFITSTVFFTGILGCFRVPVLGGRPYELWREKMAKDDDQTSEENEIAGLRHYVL